MIRCLIALVACVVAIAAIGLRDHPDRSAPALDVPSRQTPIEAPVTADISKPAVESAPVVDKYALLLYTLAPHRHPQLVAALTAREAVDPRDLAASSERERELSRLLSNEEYSLYERLRESDAEQAVLRSFALDLDDSGDPLTPDQQHSLLLAKLAYADAIAALELTIAVNDRSDAGMEQRYATDVATVGLAHYRERFMEETRDFLNEAQWTALAAQEKDP